MKKEQNFCTCLSGKTVCDCQPESGIPTSGSVPPPPEVNEVQEAATTHAAVNFPGDYNGQNRKYSQRDFIAGAEWARSQPSKPGKSLQQSPVQTMLNMQREACFDTLRVVNDAKKVSPWIKVSERLPEFIKDKDYSENVLAIVEGYTEIQVMTWVYADDYPHSGYVWGNCYGDINGDACFDDEYNVTHWTYLPATPEH